MIRFLPLLLLVGCASVSALPTVAVQQTCLPMVTYTPAQEKALAAELSQLIPSDPALLFITDYGAMRAANKACLSTNKGTQKP